MQVSERIKSGGLFVTQVDPATISPGELVCRIKSEVCSKNVQLVVIDSLNGYLNATPNERFLAVHLHELLTFLAHNNVASILTMAQQGTITAASTPVDVTYLADTVLLMRFFEYSGSVRKAISVVKKRTGRPEETIREFKIASDGLYVGEPLRSFQGVLTGVPQYFGPADDMLSPGSLTENARL